MGNRTSLRKREKEKEREKENIEKKKTSDISFKVDDSNLATVIYIIKADLYPTAGEQKMNTDLREQQKSHKHLQ